MQHLEEGTIHAWLDGELPPAEQVAAEAHVAACDECKAAVAEARGFIAASSRILTALDAVPGGVLPGSTSATSTKARAPKRFTVPRAWMAAAAVLLLGTATLIVVRPRRDAAIATMAARDEATSLHSDTNGAGNAVASAPMVAAAPEPSPAPSEKAANAPRDEKDALRKKADRPMIVADAPAAPARESAKTSSQTGEPGGGPAIRMRASDAVAAQAPAPAAAPTSVRAQSVRAQFADSAGSVSNRREASANGDIPITGRVVSEGGAPLASATVQLEGTGIVTQTHDDGRFTMTVPASRADGKSRTLVARVIGYEVSAVPIVAAGDSINQDFVLRANPLRLGEVVVTGAGTTASAEKLGSAINSADSAKHDANGSLSALAGKRTVSDQKSGVLLENGVMAELASRTSSGESGEPVEISIYRINGINITFIDRLRPDTTRATVGDPATTKIESAYDKQGAPINRLAWKDSAGRMRTLRGTVSLELLQQLKRALDQPMP